MNSFKWREYQHVWKNNGTAIKQTLNRLQLSQFVLFLLQRYNTDGSSVIVSSSFQNCSNKKKKFHTYKSYPLSPPASKLRK